MGRGFESSRTIAFAVALTIGASGCLVAGNAGVVIKGVAVARSQTAGGGAVTSNPGPTTGAGRRAPAWPTGLAARVAACACDRIVAGGPIGGTSSPAGTVEGPFAPGSLVCLKGQFSSLSVKNVSGSDGNPVHVMACGDQPTRIAGGGVDFRNVHDVHFSGSGMPNVARFGIVIARAAAGSISFDVSDFSSDYEIEGVEINGLTLVNGKYGAWGGFRVMPPVDCNDPSTQRGTPLSPKNIFIHDNWIHHLDGQAMGIGHVRAGGTTGQDLSSYSANCGGANAALTFYPALLQSISIYRNRVDHVGANGIKCDGHEHGQVFENVVTDYAESHQDFEDYGMSAGGGVDDASYFNNLIMRGHWHGPGFMFAGNGLIRAYNNILVDSTAAAMMVVGIDDGNRRYFVDHNTFANATPTSGFVLYNSAAGSTFRFKNNLVMGLSDAQAFPSQGERGANYQVATGFDPASPAYAFLKPAALVHSFPFVGGESIDLPFEPVRAANSPIVGAGLPLSSESIGFDFDFVDRNLSLPDVGAISAK